MARVKARADAGIAHSRSGVDSWPRGMAGCTVIQGHARFEAPGVVRVGQDLLEAPRIFINVGGRAIVPDLQGIDRISYLTNTSILALDRVPGISSSSAAPISGSNSPRCTAGSARR